MESSWPGLSAEEKLARRFAAWLAAEGVAFTSAEAAQSYRQRVQRFVDVIGLKVPDRVPVCPFAGFFPAYYAGITPEEAMYDYDRAVAAWQKYVFDFAPDASPGTSYAGSGRALELLGYRLYRWPGHGVPAGTPFQCVEAEYMKADEYDAFIADPSDFIMRVYLPRICGALEPLSKLGSLFDILELPVLMGSLVVYGAPDVRAALGALLEAGKEAYRWDEVAGAAGKAIAAAGFPDLAGGFTKAPFDAIADTLRGTQGAMLDMYRQPGKLLEALERITPLMIRQGVSSVSLGGSPAVFIPLHKGADGFMSAKQYGTFYWPTLKKVILALIEEGLVVYLFAEGGYNSRLEVIRDLPPGRTIWMFDQTDMAEAKAVLGDVACIMGSVPSSLLSTGTPDAVKDYCKKLIDVAGRGGGFILSAGSVIDTARPENMLAMIDTAKEYGVYK